MTFLVSTPRPFTRKTLPDGVPSGIFRVTVAPSRVGTVSLVPRVASAKVTGTTSVRFWPSRPNTASCSTWTMTNRSPAGPPLRPAPPRPLSRMRWPSETPAGMRTLTSRGRRSMPEPRHVEQGSVMTEPEPPHAGQGVENENMPWLSSSTPRPLQF